MTSDVHYTESHGLTIATHGLASCATALRPYGAGDIAAPTL